MIDDAVFLARIQFAFTMAFHIIFPSFTIGLVAWIATLEAMWLSTGASAIICWRVSGPRSSPFPSHGRGVRAGDVISTRD